MNDVTQKLKNPPKPKRLVDYIAILLDSSSSIAERGFTDKMFDALMEQDANIKRLAEDKTREVVVRYYTFSYGVGGFSVPDRNKYRPSGGTNLYGAICQAVEDFQLYDRDDVDASFLIVAMTDGEHNQTYYAGGHHYGSNETGGVTNLINTKTLRGNWTFVGIVPKGYKYQLTKIGVPVGNIMEFDVNQAKEYERFSGQTVASTQSYATSRTMGVRGSSTFFTDASKATTSDLLEVGHMYKKYAVPREMRLDTLITYEQGKFEKGRTFYQLTKPEKLAEGRAILLRDKSTKRIFGGSVDTVRGKLGLPATGDIRVKPGNHAGFDIFVLSKSDNRLLVRGTDVLYQL